MTYVPILPRANCFSRRFKARLNPPSPTADSKSPHVHAGPKKDYSLKEGQTFTIAIPGRNKPSNAGQLLVPGSETSSSASSAGVPLLPPPPSVSKKA